MHRKIEPKYSAPVLIQEKYTRDNVITISLHKVTINEQNKHATLLVAKLIFISDETESPVFFLNAKCCLMTVDQIQTTMQTQRIPVPKA